jgi:hypothetical protein
LPRSVNDLTFDEIVGAFIVEMNLHMMVSEVFLTNDFSQQAPENQTIVGSATCEKYDRIRELLVVIGA